MTKLSCEICIFFYLSVSGFMDLCMISLQNDQVMTNSQLVQFWFIFAHALLAALVGGKRLNVISM
uniref:Uncharacterized protein n=1 Tax=Nelumbo nucifera TaxID=4432 RepID=A0A822Y1W2_NELNU|nr:TPA_asm: hypothetical protein HUJ06_026519 [Nelumbo nucifera]